MVFEIHDVLHLPDEPRVYFREFVDTFDGIALFESLRDGEDAQVCGVGKLVVEVVEARVVVAHEAVHALSYHSQSLLQNLLEGASDGHNLPDGLHRRADLTADAGKLGEVPSRNLAYHIVEVRRVVCGVRRAGFSDLVECVAECNLRRHEGEGVAGGFRCEG